jgi:hypothetical protein
MGSLIFCFSDLLDFVSFYENNFYKRSSFWILLGVVLIFLAVDDVNLWGFMFSLSIFLNECCF